MIPVSLTRISVLRTFLISNFLRETYSVFFTAMTLSGLKSDGYRNTKLKYLLTAGGLLPLVTMPPFCRKSLAQLNFTLFYVTTPIALPRVMVTLRRL